MSYRLPPLPYPYDALEPWVSGDTLRLHHDVLHAGYVERLNQMTRGRPRPPLEDLIQQAPPGPVLDNAAQVYNHDFLWRSMTPGGGGAPGSSDPFTWAFLRRWSWRGFVGEFVAHAGEIFGSGYVWLVTDGRELDIMPAKDADNPLRYGLIPLLTVDVWEHAYLLDYGSERKEYVRQFLEELANWDLAAARYRRMQ